MALDGLCHLLHGAVDRRILYLEPIVRVPADEKPHVFFPEQLLLVDLREESETTVPSSNVVVRNAVRERPSLRYHLTNSGRLILHYINIFITY